MLILQVDGGGVCGALGLVLGVVCRGIQGGGGWDARTLIL